MALTELIKNLADQANRVRDQLTTEEATKNALVMLFVSHPEAPSTRRGNDASFDAPRIEI